MEFLNNIKKFLYNKLIVKPLQNDVKKYNVAYQYSLFNKIPIRLSPNKMVRMYNKEEEK